MYLKGFFVCQFFTSDLRILHHVVWVCFDGWMWECCFGFAWFLSETRLMPVVRSSFPLSPLFSCLLFQESLVGPFTGLMLIPSLKPIQLHWLKCERTCQSMGMSERWDMTLCYRYYLTNSK